MMQAIWSRTAQTRSCRCRSCFHAATNVARRATTATSRRRLKVSDLFTACYSTILATAAVADARVKEDRRREWDRAIAEVKESTSWVDLKVDGEDPNSPGTVASQPELKTYSPWKDTESRRVAASNFETRLKVLDQEIRESTQDFNVAEGLVAHGIEHLQEASELEWIDEEPDEILPERDPKCPLHLARRELSCANLVEQLLARLVGSVQKRTNTSPSQQLHPEFKDMVVRIQHLRSEFKKLPTYKWEDLAIIERERRALHRSLLEICDAATFDNIPSLELMLAKICYNLLVSQTPVSMVTYNILIQALDRLKQYDLAQVIVDSFLYETKLKPNRNSIRIILDHYHQKNDREGWRAMKNRMRATEGDMRIKRRWHEDLDILPIQDWIYKTDPRDMKFQKGVYSKFLTQKPPRDANIFDALIRTSLTFNGPRNAVMHIKRALKDYHQIYSDTICAVMEELLKQRDGRGSTSLINQILTLWDEGSDPSAIAFTGAVRRLIYQLLDMIGVDTTLGSQLTPPNKLPLAKVQAMLRQLRIFSIEESVGRTEAFVETIEDHLAGIHNSQARGIGISHLLNPAKDMAPTQELNSLQPKPHLLQHPDPSHLDTSRDVGSFSASKANQAESVLPEGLRSLEWFAAVEKARVDDLAWNTASGRWSRLELLDAQLDHNMQILEGLEAQILPFALKAMPRYQQLRYLDITSSNMVYSRKEDRPSQYQELLRVRREGAMGLLSFVEKQVEFHRAVFRKIQAEVFSLKTIAYNRLSHRDRDFYLGQAAKSIAVGNHKAAYLAKSINDLSKPEQNPFLNDQRCDDKNILRRIRTLERQAREMGNYNDNLHQMWENLYCSLQRDCMYKAEKLVKVNARVLGKFEDHIFEISPYALKWTLPRAKRMVHLSERKVHDLAAAINAIRPRWTSANGGATSNRQDLQTYKTSPQVDENHRSVQDQEDQKVSRQAGNLPSSHSSKNIEEHPNASLLPSAHQALELAPVMAIGRRSVAVAAVAG